MPTVEGAETRVGSNSADYHTPQTVEDVTKRNVQSIVRLEEAAKANRDLTDRMADGIARFCGRFTFVWVHLIWFSAWVVINSIPGLPHFDPFPFTFLTLVVSLEAIFLSTFILISQNHETRLSERRNQLDWQINLLTAVLIESKPLNQLTTKGFSRDGG